MILRYLPGDICRVCRAEGTSEKPLYHPCICTGSIKFIHQEWCVFVYISTSVYISVCISRHDPCWPCLNSVILLPFSSLLQFGAVAETQQERVSDFTCICQFVFQCCHVL